MTSNILRLSVGDFVAKTLYFLAFVYLARVLGVTNYGLLEFAIAILTYLLFLADGGLEFWATRAAAQGETIQHLAARVIPLRLILASCAFGVLMALLLLLPDYSALRTILLLFGFTLFIQAISVKWVFVSQEQMSQVATGLMITQLVFALAVFTLVRSPVDVIWIPLLRAGGDLAMEGYFWHRFAHQYGGFRLPYTLRDARKIVPPAFMMGLSQVLGLLSYNFDTVLLGFLAGATAVSWYNAAYRPVTVLLAMPVTYFLGIFPTFARTYVEGEEAFRAVIARSLRLVAILAVPVGVGGTFLAEPIIHLLFGLAYANAVLPLQLLAWSATLVILRGTYRQGLNAAGRQGLDVRSAGLSVVLNVLLNLGLIPHYGIIGAAIATLLTDALWLVLTSHYFCRYVTAIPLLPFLWQPAVATLAMGSFFLLTQPLFWITRAIIGVMIYFLVLWTIELALRGSWVQTREAQAP